MQADIVAPIFMGIRLQKLTIRIQLDREQVRHIENAFSLAEILTDTLLLGERIRHLGHPLNSNASAKHLTDAQPTKTTNKEWDRQAMPTGPFLEQNYPALQEQ
jgi:hypothetical protein